MERTTGEGFFSESFDFYMLTERRDMLSNSSQCYTTHHSHSYVVFLPDSHIGTFNMWTKGNHMRDLIKPQVFLHPLSFPVFRLIIAPAIQFSTFFLRVEMVALDI